MSLNLHILCDNTLKGTNMKKIPLTQGKYALVDNEDFAELSKWRWTYDAGYARRSTLAEERREGFPNSVNMQRQILGFPQGMDTDHINGDKLDNRQSNLRVCTHTENTRNRRKYNHNKSGYVGVHWHKANKKWIAQIKVNQKVIYLGSFIDIKEAIKVRTQAAKEHFGEFARQEII